jgi:two-component system, OmpR family, response regulator
LFEEFIQQTIKLEGQRDIAYTDYYEIKHRNRSEADGESKITKSSRDETMVTQKNSNYRSNKLKQTRILIAESEPEILSLFKLYLDSLGIESITADNGEKALSTFLQSKEEGKNYDAVILDTNLKEQEGLEVAKKIRENDNRQRIILVTTKMKEQLPKEKLQSTAINDSDILVMPFRLSNLSKVLNQ